MNTEEFWQTIDEVHAYSGNNMDRKCSLLADRLSKLSDSDLTDFIHHFDSADAKAYTWPLWGAAYVMHGGCSDDSFLDFRAILISQGRTIYEQAILDPDSLASLELRDEDGMCYEGYQYVMSDVAEERFEELPKRSISLPDDPAGNEWDEDELDTLYPKLTTKYSTSIETGPPNPNKPWWKFW